MYERYEQWASPVSIQRHGHKSSTTEIMLEINFVARIRKQLRGKRNVAQNQWDTNKQNECDQLNIILRGGVRVAYSR